jgi:hypothetical protein
MPQRIAAKGGAFGSLDDWSKRCNSNNRNKKNKMSLASGHHRIMAAARGALVMMVLGKVEKLSYSSRPQI